MNIQNKTELAKRRLAQLEKMYRIRFFEEKIDDLFAQGALGGTCHLCIGQEAAAVGVIGELIDGDKVVSSHRGHGHIIAMGGRLDRLFGELMEKEIGYCKGRGGTQHLSAADIGFYGTNGITGGGIPIATGLALAAKRDKNNNAVATFFGDGGTNQGVFHESLNMAAVWNLPIVFVCENNLYAMSTPIERTSKVKDVAEKSKAHGILGITVDGNDISKVEEQAIISFEHARSGRGPVLLELKTYRHKGHSKSDNRAYRTKEEELAWLESDCIRLLRSTISDMGYNSEATKIKTHVLSEVEEAVSIAQAAPIADPSHLLVRNKI